MLLLSLRLARAAARASRARLWLLLSASIIQASSISAVVIAIAPTACSDSSNADEPPIGLPDRDGASSPDGPQQCGNADTASDPNNCGSCGNVCPSGPRASPSCSQGRCALACATGFGDCNGNAADGCEVDLATTIEHCGSCGHDCRSCSGDPLGKCSSGVCDSKTLSTLPRDVRLLALDPASDAQITYADSDEVAQVDRGDAGVRGVYGVPNTPGILVRGNVLLIYPGTEAFSGIYSTYAGFVGPQIAAFARGESAEAMAMDDTGIYYAVAKGGGVSKIMRCKNCSVATELSPTENRVGQSGIALDETTVFFGAGDVIRRVEKTGAELKTLVVGQAPRSLGVDATHVYWVNESPPPIFGDAGAAAKGEVVRMLKGGGTPEKIIVGLSNPTFLVVTENHLYVTDRNQVKGPRGVLLRTAKDGSQRVDLARDITLLGGLAVDSKCAWFGAGKELRMIAR